MDDLVAVDPEAIRPVVKVQASDEHSIALDSCLSTSSPPSSSSSSSSSSSRATKRQLAPPLDAFVLSDVVSPEECARLRGCAEAADYSFWNAATSTSTFRNSDTVEITGTQVAGELWERVKHLVVPRVTISPTVDDDGAAGAAAVSDDEEEEERAEGGVGGGGDDKLWEPGLEGEWEAYGINAHLLFNRYGPGGHFSPHTDGATIVDMNRRSLYSMLVYLNHCPLECGGGTALFTPPEGTSMRRYRWPEEWRADVAPVEPGTALVFSQDTPHEGVPVGPGHEKVIIRTDVMYRRVPPVFDHEVGVRAYDLHRQAQAAEGEGNHMEAMRLYRHCRRLCPEYADFVGMG